MRFRSRLLAAAATALLSTAVLVGVGQAPALASNCSHAHPYLDGTGGYVTGSDANVRTGPHYPPGLSCSSNGLAYYGYAAQYYCYDSGDTYQGWSTWTWVYVPAINKSGWVNDYLLVGNGSNYHC